MQQQPSFPPPPKELIAAAEKGEIAKLREFAQNATFGNPDKEGLTALIAAAESGQKAAFAAIIAIANEQVKQQFVSLPKQGQPGVVTAINAMSMRSVLFTTADKNGMTPLMFAASRGWEEAIEPLLEGGAPKSSLDKDGKSAADHAASAGFQALAETLRSAK